MFYELQLVGFFYINFEWAKAHSKYQEQIYIILYKKEISQQLQGWHFF